MEVYLKLHRLLYDPDRGIPIETMHPEKADWETLNLNGPPPLGVKAIDAKRQFQREQEDRLTRSVVVAKPKPGRPLGGKKPPPPPAPATQQARTRSAIAAAASAPPAKRGRATTPIAAKGVSTKRKPVSPSATPSSTSSGDEVEETLTAMRPGSRKNVSLNFVIL